MGQNSNSDLHPTCFPARIRGLERLSYNLWWSWHRQARELFRALDLQAWRESAHNPLRMLALLPKETLDQSVEDPIFLEHYDLVMEQFDREMASPEGWFTSEYGSARGPLAYFSAEYAFHHSLPLYAGGLGVLAGDYIKECSDLAIPVVAVGLIYSRGYISQKIRDDGWQEDDEKALDRTYDPVKLLRNGSNEPIVVQVPLFDPPVHVSVWKADVGRVPVYLLDTEVEGNQPWDRAIAHRLYTNDPEQRLRQEIVLGLGGMRVLEALGISPAAVHINEGHPALAFLERARLLVEAGAKFEDAIAEVRRTSIFTTHTPLPAGTDVFPFPLFDKYVGSHHEQFGARRESLLQLGTNPSNPDAGFNMTVFALRMAAHSNAVSKKHGEVAREMWAALWPDKKKEKVPISAVTNGVHVPTWMDPIWLQPMLEKYLGPDWIAEQENPKLWERVDEIPDEDIWGIRMRLKGLLIAEINERAREDWTNKRVRAESVIALGALLDPQILTLGFARRFTGYKRPDLILNNIERIRHLLINRLQPVQIIFAGKAHLADTQGAQLIQKVFHLAQDPEFGARLAFVEDYDQYLAQRMVRGVDVWLNNPLPPLEASGTSGMKAGVNGVPSLSILDGWWLEGFNGANGWAFGGEHIEGDRTKADADALYRLLEEEIVPMYYRRPDDGIPHDLVRVIKSTIKSVTPQFSSRRMVKQYVRQLYSNALGLDSGELSGASSLTPARR
jgi:starch phosphorylase